MQFKGVFFAPDTFCIRKPPAALALSQINPLSSRSTSFPRGQEVQFQPHTLDFERKRECKSITRDVLIPRAEVASADLIR